MVKHKTSPAVGLTLTLLLSQLPHVNSASATILADRKPSCLTCSAARDAHSSPGDLTTLGRRTQPLPLKPVQRSVFEGLRVNYVSAATGDLAFAVTDLELGGALPVLFRRVYDGARRGEDAGLGAGRSFAFQRIRTEGISVTLLTSIVPAPPPAAPVKVHTSRRARASPARTSRSTSRAPTPPASRLAG
jgi:hypothetical protein